MERIAKIIARSGFCSRREAEKFISQKKVHFKEDLVLTPATLIEPRHVGLIKISGKKLPQKLQESTIWIHNKKPGYVVSRTDPEGRPSLMPVLANILNIPHLISVGRLDINSEGLLLITNDGKLANQLTHPSNKIPRTYHVKYQGDITKDMISRMDKGLKIDNIFYEKMILKQLKQGYKNSDLYSELGGRWCSLTLYQGKNRQIKNVFQHFGLHVQRIVRMEFGPYKLNSLEKGGTKEMGILEPIKQYLN